MLLYVHKAFKDDHSCSDIQLSVAQKIDSCPARKVGPLPKKLMRNGNGIKKFVLVGSNGWPGGKKGCSEPRSVHPLVKEIFHGFVFLFPFLDTEYIKGFRDKEDFCNSQFNRREGKEGSSDDGDRFVEFLS